MTTDPTFTAEFRRPGVEEPGRLITMTIGDTGTRLALGDDVLGTWSNDAIRFTAEPDLAMTIAGETWLLTVDDPAEFRSIAEPRYIPADIDLGALDQAEPPPDTPSDTELEDPDENQPLADPPPVKSDPMWRTLAPGAGVPALLITALVAVGCMLTALATTGLLSPLLAFASGVTGFASALMWRAVAARRALQSRPSVGPDVDAEARVARAVARALSARTVTSTLEGQSVSELTMIKGIGPQYAQLLADVGVRSIDDLAKLTKEQRMQLERALGRHGERVQRERWEEQARKIVQARRSSHAFR
jgi:predicted flap endonuclease-1-like 5' DNA nuclease